MAFTILTSVFLLSKPEFCIPIVADYEKLGSALANLISNAIKHSPKGKEMEVKCILSYAVTVGIKDEGMCIKLQDKWRLFERYYWVQSQHTQNISGFGIDLHLCEEIIEKDDGKLFR
ncbi:ATP-binding protein [Mucilaginibacter lappiensis]|uniref:histidine kinase n=1 Tax=Mucilaginibacter lappiensis TaxID=354630 RepID=A0A841JIA7_9SPHI|nr:ATP-binding protein [Mucilaginibacter lappiensis]MBB6130670.1 signal transduction histidine kinase [Mucilaginibacter lappiensis]